MAENKYKVSLILPVYNVEKYIVDCFDSIIKQTYKNLEIIFVDDGSPDNCGKLLDNFVEQDNRVKVVHKNNEGVSIARNFGLQIATGDYICFVDPDDILKEDYVEYLLNLAMMNNVDIGLSKDMYSTYDMKEGNNKKIEIVSGEDATIDILLHKIPIGVYCKIFKKTFLDENKIKFRNDIFIGEGFNFNVTSFQRSEKISVGNKRIYIYRTDNPNSAVTNFKEEKWWNAIYALECIKNDMTIKNKKISNALKFAKWYDGVYILSLLKKNDLLGKYKKLQEKSLQDIRQNSFSVFCVKVPVKQKLKAILLSIHPVLIGKIIL